RILHHGRRYKVDLVSAMDSDVVRRGGQWTCSCRHFRFARPVEFCPVRLDRANGNSPGFQRDAPGKRVRDAIETHKCEATAPGGRAEHAELLDACHNRQAW